MCPYRSVLFTAVLWQILLSYCPLVFNPRVATGNKNNENQNLKG